MKTLSKSLIAAVALASALTSGAAFAQGGEDSNHDWLNRTPAAAARLSSSNTEARSGAFLGSTVISRSGEVLGTVTSLARENGESTRLYIAPVAGVNNGERFSVVVPQNAVARNGEVKLGL